MEGKKMFLGFDFSTQQLKAIAINEQLEVTHEVAVQFDNDLPEYRTQGGVNKHLDKLTVTSPTIMWVKALDMVLEKLKVAGVDFATVAALSGSGQQHGSVYWKKGSEDVLTNLESSKFLHDQLQGCFAIRDSPIWMDSSTTAQCRALEKSVGGPQKLADITGSRGFERFTGNQISKVYQTKPEAYKYTERISLVSSFAASLFIGKYAPIDYSDGSGMNLLNINTKLWEKECLDSCAPGLQEKLGEPVPSNEVIGKLSKYYVERYGFSSDCDVIAFTGDNSASVAGMRLQEKDVVVSLGTSDTVLVWLNEAHPMMEGHILCNPITKDAFYGMLCFKNGSLTRERIRDECADGSWMIFSELLNSTPRGNFGNIGMYFDLKEILPPLVGDFKFNKMNEQISKFSKEVEVRAVIEGQFVAKRMYAEKLGYSVGPGSKVLATGGASKNEAVIQVLADVFNAPVYTLNVANSTCVGSAYLAMYGHYRNEKSFTDIVKEAGDLRLVATPSKDANEIYQPMVERYKKLEEVLKQNYQEKL